MKPSIRIFLTAASISVAITSIAALRAYQQESAEGERRVREFWGELGDEYQPQNVLQPFPPLLNPPAVNGDQIGEEIAPDELVLGVEVNGSARAYPINMLTGPEREIFNDKLGGRDIAATW